MFTRTALRILIALAAVAALPASASGATFHVTESGTGVSCSLMTPCSLGSAISHADASSGPDTIVIAGPFEGSSPIDLARSEIRLIGSGSGEGGTSIETTADPAVRVGAGSSLSDVRVRSTAGVGVAVASGSGTTVLENVSVEGQRRGVDVETVPGTVTIRSSTVRGGVAGGYVRDFAIERSLVEGQANRDAVILGNGHIRVVSSVVRSHANGLFLGISATADILGSTLIGSGAPGSAGVEIVNLGRSTPTLVQSSIVRGFHMSLESEDQVGTLVARSSNLTPQPDSRVVDGGGNIDADPLFVDAAAGDYRLRPGSPSIDREDPSRAALLGELDLGGLARVADGDGDGDARPDQGAYEAVYTTPPVAGGGATPPVAAPEPQPGDGAPEQPGGGQPAADEDDRPEPATGADPQPEAPSAGGPQPAAQPAPPAQLSARVVRLGAARVRFGRRGVATTTVTASASGRVSVVAKLDGKIVGRGSAAVRAGRAQRVTIRLTSAGKRVWKKRGRALRDVAVTAILR